MRVIVLRWGAVGTTLGLATLALAAPADRLPTPRPEPCLPFDAEPEASGMVTAEGLSHEAVRAGLNAVIQTALYCDRPEGFDAVHLTFDLVIGCDGVVSRIETVDDGGAPADYVQCVSDVVAKADFPAHDMEGGMPVTYPVNVAW